MPSVCVNVVQMLPTIVSVTRQLTGGPIVNVQTGRLGRAGVLQLRDPTTYIYIHPPYPTPYPLFFLLPTLRSSASSSMALHRQAQNKTKKTFPPHIHLVFPQEFPWPKQNNPQDHRVSETPHPHKKTTPIYKRVLNQSSHGVRIKGISIVGEETKREAKTRGDHICQAHFCRTGS